MCFFSLLPTLFPLGRGPFASLARVSRHPRVGGDPFLKTERLRWGSPTATTLCEPLEFGLCVFVILAYAGIHSLQLVSLDSRIRGNDGREPP